MNLKRPCKGKRLSEYAESRWYKSWNLCVLVAGILFSGHSLAQEAKLTTDLRAGLKLSYYLGRNNSYTESGSHFTFGICVGATFRNDKRPFALHLQTGVNIYAAGLGTNLLNTYYEPDGKGGVIERRRKMELDFVNSAMANVEWGGRISEEYRSFYPIQHFNHMTPYINNLYKNATVTYGVNYIFNTSNRNQTNTFIGAASPWASFGMYNDGSTIFLLGDQYDRFWTGGGYIRLNPVYSGKATKAGPRNEWSVEYNFNRFTYDVQDGYRLANFLMIPMVQDASIYNLLYNNSLTTFKINLPRNMTVGWSIMGETKRDIQDFLHQICGYPHHVTSKKGEGLFTATYNPVIK